MHDHGHGHQKGHGLSKELGYEVSDVQVKLILVSGLAVVIMTAIAYAAGTFVVKYVRAQEPIGTYRATPVALEEQNKPWDLPTRLQVDPPRALREFKGEQKQTENSYGVVSAEPEIYRIPVEAAMKIVAEKGLPKFPKLSAPEGQAPK